MCRRLLVTALVGTALSLLTSVSSLSAEPAALVQVARTAFRGRIVDATQSPIAGATVTATPATGAPVSALTNVRGDFSLDVEPGQYTIAVDAPGFVSGSRSVSVRDSATPFEMALQVAGVRESVTVEGQPSYQVPVVRSAMKTDTPLRDIPQSITVVSSALIADQRIASMADVVRYIPGAGIAQGEGNRDTPILRGNASTADFYVDGVRDDVQYFRDVYNMERIEAVKGPNAMIFGRGGAGGVINRVSRQADWAPAREASVQFGSNSNRRLTLDVGQGLNDTTAVRATGLYENSDSFRDGAGIERYGFNPTVAVRLGALTTLRVGYEIFHDERVADRGISSFQGLPVATAPETFFGDPTQSPTEATVNLLSAVVEHNLRPGVAIRNRLTYGDYDKFYQNVFPGAVNAAGTTVSISAYNQATTRQNLFNQTDLTVGAQTGRVNHTMLVGLELGRQSTANFRETGYFSDLGPAVTSMQAPLSAPRVSVPVAFRQSATDADNQGVVNVASIYAQDQIAFSDQIEAVVGLRFDSFRADVTNNRTGDDFAGDDNLLSPRLGLIYKPVAPVSLYASYSLSYLPRSGEQLTSLSLTNQALDPETFRNYEVGAKWDPTSAFAVTAAVYRLDRGNVVVPDPNDPTISILVDAQRTRGFELGVTGNVTSSWSVAGGYAYQDGEITRSISATAMAGASLAQLPKNSLSLWNKYDLTSQLGLGLGLIYRGDVFTSTDNTVLLPSFTRVDLGVFYQATRQVRLQLNVENLFDENYYANAHSNTNITPGSPRAVQVALTTRF